MYGYAPYHLTARSQVPSIDPAMHSTISFPGSSPRASTLPIHAPKEGISDVLASPQAHMGYRVPQTPVVPDRERSGQRGSSLIDMGTGYEANVKRTRHTVEAGRSRKRIISADARGMEDEVSRLLASCEAREATIKLYKADIEDRLFVELNQAISPLSQTDTEANNLLAKSEESITSTKPILSDRVSQLYDNYQSKVISMERRSTPWRGLQHPGLLSIHPPSVTSEDESTDSEGRMRIASGGDEAALARIEGCLDEIKNYLTSEIAVLRAQDQAGKRSPLGYIFWTLISIMSVLFIAISIAYVKTPRETGPG